MYTGKDVAVAWLSTGQLATAEKGRARAPRENRINAAPRAVCYPPSEGGVHLQSISSGYHQVRHSAIHYERSKKHKPTYPAAFVYPWISLFPSRSIENRAPACETTSSTVAQQRHTENQVNGVVSRY